MAYPTSGSSWPGTSTGEFDNYVGLFKEAYSDMIRLKTQTTESVLSDTLLLEQLQGDPLNLDSYKGVDLVQRDRGQQYGNNTGDGDINYEMTAVERRTVVPEFWEYAELFDPRDECGSPRWSIRTERGRCIQPQKGRRDSGCID